ncbi:DNA polymerase beta superfamily protein [Nesterenkonia flava]|uniref:Nucleotidyltransferase domain-containing protein n=1 Tax=Nesterenkonia flava TaxID=469799 RepID=A0ABU1FW80_9MICC|nr:nucleotidyltransferase domain-containing protein [Nesterenkonia flava]MDR5712934.1 nucleotidyltransferase domain-containing protein [Nesterenkonia flava]
MSAILTTVHGSHLYGLANQGSDQDTYTVTTGTNKEYARQTKTGDDDALQLHLHRFLDQVRDGVPQALEALWSPVAKIHPDWEPMLRALRPGIHEARARYRRTILNFAFKHGGRTGAAREHADRAKLRRHAVRLTINLAQLTETGSIQPRLNSDQIRLVRHVAALPGDDYADTLIAMLESAEGWPA